jgi:hypothetical protein
MKRLIPMLVAGILTFGVLQFSRMAPIRADPTEYIPPETITPAPAPEPQATPTLPEYTAEELETLAIIIYQEAGGDNFSDYIRECVGCVVLNRVNNPKFPNTVQEVATQKSQWGRLYWTGITWPKRASLPSEAHAVDRARACAKKLLEADTRPVPENVIWCAEFPQGTGTWLHRNGIYFCY